MFVKYDKTYHIFPVTSKFNLDNTQIQRLLSGKVVVEEKMDGANIGIIRHNKGFSLQKRGSLVGQSEHEQFGYFHNWANTIAYERIMSVPKGHLIYGELLYAKHHIYYDSLPEYVLVFDVKINGVWMKYEERKKFCDTYGFHMVPLIAEGAFTKLELPDLMPEKSVYGPECEGIVIKRYAKHGYFRGKMVKPGFIKALEDSEHWTKYNIERNTLRV